MHQIRPHRSVTHHRPARPGVASSEIIILLIAAVSIGSIAAFVGPRLLRAGQAASTTQTETDPVLEGIRELVESSIEVFAIEHEPLTGDTFVVLWGGDPDDKTKINRGEIAVLHYSVARQVISALVCTKPTDAFDGIGKPPTDTTTRRVLPTVINSGAFAQQWVGAPDVQRRVIGAEVRSFRFERIDKSNRTELFRIALTRVSAESDGDLVESSVEARLGASAASDSP